MKKEYLNLTKKEATQLYKNGSLTYEELLIIKGLRDKEYQKKYQKEYSKTHAEQKRVRARKYYQEHQEECRENMREYSRRKYAEQKMEKNK